MNTHEAWKGTIMGKEGECAAFVIDTVASPFLLSGITKPIADCQRSAGGDSANF